MEKNCPPFKSLCLGVVWRGVGRGVGGVLEGCWRGDGRVTAGCGAKKVRKKCKKIVPHLNLCVWGVFGGVFGGSLEGCWRGVAPVKSAFYVIFSF